MFGVVEAADLKTIPLRLLEGQREGGDEFFLLVVSFFFLSDSTFDIPKQAAGLGEKKSNIAKHCCHFEKKSPESRLRREKALLPFSAKLLLGRDF